MRKAAAHRTRAFTLIEVMVTVGITVAIAGLAFPLYSPLLSRHEFDSALDAAVAQCEHARAEAQQRGMALEVVISGGGTRLEVRPVNLLADAEDDAEASGDAGGDGMEGALRGSAAARKLGAEMERRMERISQGVMRNREPQPVEWNEAWATLDLSEGMCASVDAPLSSDQDNQTAREFATARAAEDAAQDGRVALFLPDGTAVATRGYWLQCEGRAARVDVDPLLGHATRREMPR